MVRDLSDVRTLSQALADLIVRRDEQPQSTREREVLERMIRDLQAEIAIRNKSLEHR